MNNVFLGSGDPILGSMPSATELAARAEALRALEQQALNMRKNISIPQPPLQQQPPAPLLWDEIDSEVTPLTEEQKNRLFSSEDYARNYQVLQSMVQDEVINLVKAKIEGNPKGKEVLTSQLQLVRKLKGKIIEETNREMETFKKFREFARQHPEATYEDFVKSNL